MKTTSTLFFLVAILFSIPSFSQGSMDIEFPTTGNCYLCKVRIENAVNKLDGIESVLWDATTDVTYVTYDDTQIDAYEIMQTIAFVGHETEWYPANDSAYASLEGSCCFYTKVIDYTNVQMGYLGMMGIWLWQLTGVEDLLQSDIQVSPSVGNGLFNISGSDLAVNEKLNIRVYTMNGQIVFHEQMFSKSNHQLNVQHLISGYYIITLSNGSTILHKTKVFKN